MFESHQLEKLIQVGTQTLRILIANSSQQQKLGDTLVHLQNQSTLKRMMNSF